jgi:hypothetical protein
MTTFKLELSVENNLPQPQYTYWNVVNRMCIQRQFVGISLLPSFIIKNTMERRISRSQDLVTHKKKTFVRLQR